MNRQRYIMILVLILNFVFCHKVIAETPWLKQAKINVDTPGIIESILPPDLHLPSSSPLDKYLDLQLLGPDTKSRAFELFWREKETPKQLLIVPDSVKIDDNKRLVWEATIAEKFKINKIEVGISDVNYIGKVDIEGLDPDGWKALVNDVALYQTKKHQQLNVSLPEGEYQKIRLYFSGFDKEYQETPVLVNSVAVMGQQTGKDYAETSFTIKASDIEVKKDNIVECRVNLPGQAIFIKKFEINTSAFFQGKWEIGYEAIALGKRKFVSLKKGEVSIIDKNKAVLFIENDAQWPGKQLVLKLDPTNYFGEIIDITVTVRLPRLVFFADQEGEYVIQTGVEKEVFIRNTPGDRERLIDQELSFVSIENNAKWHPQEIVKKYNIKGGPINKQGFAWSSDIEINETGFYQLVLSDIACLDKSVKGIRIGKDDSQIPYFFGKTEERKIQLENDIAYNDDNNQTVSLITLPLASAAWRELELESVGVFNRNLIFQKHIQGKEGWQPWISRPWVNSTSNEAIFKLDLSDFPKDQSEIRLIIENGDNEPLTINKIMASYEAHDLFFLASSAGTYTVIGGNPISLEANYDLSMIQQYLLSAIPKEILLGAIEPVKSLKEKQLLDPVGGALFNQKGYTWRSSINIEHPDFYQIVFDQSVSLENNRKALRLVKDGRQIPYFLGKTKNKTTQLPVEMQYDAKQNTTTWLITFPTTSSHWNALNLTTSGVFDRNLIFEVPHPGKVGWQKWVTRRWINRSKTSTNLIISLKDFSNEQNKIRITINHGDNSPLNIDLFEGIYTTQDIFFMATEQGDYVLFGGNTSIGSPVYDINLIKDRLLISEPKKIMLEKIDRLDASIWPISLKDFFSEQGWGLYAVFGFITAILMLIIWKLFPKDLNKD